VHRLGECRHLNVAEFLNRIAQAIGEREAALCSITVAELVHGIYRAITENGPSAGGPSLMI